MVKKFYIDFEDTLAQDKNIDKHTALLNIEFSSILKNLFQLLFEKLKIIKLLWTSKSFCNIGTGFKFFNKEQFINIIKNNSDYNNAALF